MSLFWNKLELRKALKERVSDAAINIFNSQTRRQEA